ncbi:protein ABHD13-like [Sycon ciliatum]|uniref:protein ABHD13-like n=1 Tax=Sycon ciliatum TaxID=27933 RepID=UPI0031F6A0D8
MKLVHLCLMCWRTIRQASLVAIRFMQVSLPGRIMKLPNTVWSNVASNYFWSSCSYALLTIFLFNWLYGGYLMFFFLLLTIAGVVYEVQDMLLYHPDHPERSRLLVRTPAACALPYENIQLVTEDGVRLNAFFIKHQGSLLATAPTVLFFHGNAGNIGDRLPHAQRLYSECHCNVLLLEYRGYGRSDGRVSEHGLTMDAHAGLDLLLARTDIDTNKIVVLGVSLGGAVATKLASSAACQRKIMALIIVNSFTSIADMGACMFHSCIAKLPGWMLRNRFSSRDAIRDIKAPALFVSGQCDRVVPPAMMHTLYEACQSRKFFFSVPGGGHNNTFLAPNYSDVIRDFLGAVQGMSAPNPLSVVNNPAKFSFVDYQDQPLPPTPSHELSRGSLAADPSVVYDVNAASQPAHRLVLDSGIAETASMLPSSSSNLIQESHA